MAQMTVMHNNGIYILSLPTNPHFSIQNSYISGSVLYTGSYDVATILITAWYGSAFFIRFHSFRGACKRKISKIPLCIMYTDLVIQKIVSYFQTWPAIWVPLSLSAQFKTPMAFTEVLSSCLELVRKNIFGRICLFIKIAVFCGKGSISRNS
ncbi:chromodomain-helicase-DNA-binding protein 9 [Platysternon megacephalum]|uniref:Chromodomain-helicase-DNA-binding protein 9 n=1 Tax=Platysternon megacephalum TaxID=55544 RepID=A0A4D9EL33_9SAUR|nr:chromodomain-helicase-DNA-binding protein 9 [Platysternon megacephalum]